MALPEDALIQAFFRAGELLSPVYKPLEAQAHLLVSSLPLSVAATLDDVRTTLDALASPHSQRLPLMNPLAVGLIVFAYLLTISAGMLVMQFLPRLNVTALAFIHNLSMVALSAYMMTGIAVEAFRSNYVLWGNPVDSTEKGWPMAKLIWLFYVSKIFEFVDTLIMVLKKNNRQISFLHVYHHTSIFTIWWLVTFIAPGGESYFSATLNSFIHVVMYGYYFLSSIGVKQVYFIRRYITSMQMTQFCMMMAQATYLLVHPNPYPAGVKPYPPFIASLLFWYMISMLALFANFFLQDKKREKTAKVKTL
ncbi:hypothetical protein HDU96_000361 [Phlyctochytrium bullatum]|nr:hypothetical protein HDU96_000361 [Phlyctochytrium bullatum]